MADTSKPGQQGLVRKRSITPANQINILPRPSQPVEHDDDDMSMSVLVDRRDDSNNKDDDDSDRDVIAAPPANIPLRRPTSLVSFQTIPSVASGSTYQYNLWSYPTVYTRNADFESPAILIPFTALAQAVAVTT